MILDSIYIKRRMGTLNLEQISKRSCVLNSELQYEEKGERDGTELRMPG